MSSRTGSLGHIDRKSWPTLPPIQYHAPFTNTSVNQSGWLIMTEWPDVVFSRTVQELSDLHSSAALSKAAN